MSNKINRQNKRNYKQFLEWLKRLGSKSFTQNDWTWVLGFNLLDEKQFKEFEQANGTQACLDILLWQKRAQLNLNDVSYDKTVKKLHDRSFSKIELNILLGVLKAQVLSDIGAGHSKFESQVRLYVKIFDILNNLQTEEKTADQEINLVAK